ncbi:ABC transporter permease [Streptomyces sp. DSM 44915]|uniref:ABC transporter permease n=1 Tax=Streptomyces chisholmiae TaxID=3075540 RepID=A0ABU2JXE2_9ACTN|nr:ABC transporter permease [Streptomyces sp. DSM 44915]MDT0269667.1 ABC transporter permease [Streptomyces sp. DSM 44915]
MKIQQRSGTGRPAVPPPPTARPPDPPTADAAPETAGPTGPRAWTSALPDAAFGVLGVLLFAATLELLPRLGVVSADYLPPFSEMLGALGEQAGESAFWTALLDTLQGWAYGLGIAVTLGVALGLVIGSVEVLRKATASTIEFLRPIPSVALIPLAVLVYGTGLESTLLLVVYAAVWPVLLQVLAGVRDVDPVARDTAASYRFTPWARLRYVLWPTTLPYLLTGLRLSASVALILAVSSELIIGSPGLGSEIARAQSSNAVAKMYALVLVTGALGVCVNVAARALERRALAWHTSVRTEAVT